MSVGGWNEVRLGAELVDRNGRRSGRTAGGPLDGIPGCSWGAGSEEGIPILERWREEADTTLTALPESLPADTPLDTVPAEPDPPAYVYFDISNDAVTPVGLIDQGECELRVTSIVGGRLQLGLSGEGIGFSLCKDTTSVWVRAGDTLRWRLSWRAPGNRCVVKISRLATREARGGSAR